MSRPFDTDPFDTDPFDTDPFDTDPFDTDPFDTAVSETGPQPGDDTVKAALLAFSPMVRPPDLSGAEVVYLVEDTAVGRLLLAARPDGALLSSAFAPDDLRADAVLDRLARLVSPRVLRGTRPLDEVRRQLEAYLSGRRREFDLPLDLALASPFQRVVLERLAGSVGYGRTTSYGHLAAEIGRPSAARAVGAALGANPLCVILPCHRVVAASGALTGYAGGIPAKRRLLDLEAGAARGPG